MHRMTRIQIAIEEQAPRLGSLAITISLMFLLVLCCRHSAFAQFMPNTRVQVDTDLHAPISVYPNDLDLKTEDGKVFATLHDFSGKMTILKGSTVEIHFQGGFLQNMKWFKGKAKVNESFNIGSNVIVREISYSDSSPSVTECTVNGRSCAGVLELGNSISLDLTEPVLATRLKPYSGKQHYLAVAAIAVLLIGAIVWLVVRKRRDDMPIDLSGAIKEDEQT